MMVGHHTVYFLQQLLDNAEGFIYDAESFAAESGDVRINYNSNCPACISIMSLIGEEKRETDPAGTYWGEGAYQNEVQHLQDGTWDFGDGQGSVQLHEPLLVGGIHHNLLGRAGTLLHDYNNNGNGNILEMGEHEECYDCGGTGEYDCYSDCDDGKQECYACDGTGDIEDDEGEDEVCDDCDGSGEEDCNSCDGQSWCNECGGSGDFWNEEIVRGIDNWYQTNVIDYLNAHGDSDIRSALYRLVEGLESGQLRTTYGQEMYNEANHKLYNDLHDAIVYYVINTPNQPLPEGDSLGAETFEAEKITKDELIEYLDWLEEGEHYVFDTSPRAVRFRDLLAGDLQINSADVDFMDKDEFILLGAEGHPRGVVVESFKTVSNVYYNGKLYRQFTSRRHRERAESIAEWMMQKLSQNPRRFDYLRFGAEDYTEEDALADSIIGQTIFNYVQIKDYLKQNLTDEAIEFLDYNIQVAFDELIDEDMRQQVEHVMNTNRFEAETFEARFVRSLNTPRQPMPWDLEPNMVEEGMPYLTRREYDSMRKIGYTDEEIRNGYQRSFGSELFEAEGKPTTVQVKRSTNDEKKLMAVFTYPDGKTKTTHFGQRGASDYTKHGEKDRMELYLERHAGKAPSYTTSSREDWKDPTTAGALSRWILWNKPSLKSSFDDYKSRFGLKGSINVSKSAEERRRLISELVCFKCGVKDEIANYNWNENAKGCCGMGVREKQYYAKSAETFEARDTSWCVNHGWIHNTKIGDIISCTSCKDMICEGCRCGGCGNCQTSDCCECKNASETFEDKVQYIIFNTKQSRQMPTHIIKVMDERLDFKTLCGMYIKGKGWNNAGVPAKISSKDNPSGLCYKCVEKQSETFATEYTPSQTLGEYDARELALSSVATGDFFTDSLKFSTTRKASEEDEDAKKLREYEKTYGKKQAKIRMRLKRKIYKERSMGTKAGQWSARKSQKLKREYEKACERAGLKPYKGGKTEKQDDLEDWSDQKWKTSSGKKSSKTGEPYFPAKAIEALKKKGLYAKAKRQKAKATKEGKQNARYSDDIRKVVGKYRADTWE